MPTPPESIDPAGTPLPPTRLLVSEQETPGEAPLTEAVDTVEDARTRPAAEDYRPGTTIHAPSGAKARARANLAAIGLVQQLDTERRPATAVEQDVLAAWSGWGAAPQIFETHREDWAGENERLRSLLGEREYRRAEASTLNAHYTDPAIAAAVWDALTDAGFSGGRVLEPGCGAGTFIGLAPEDATMVGVELDPTTAKIGAYLYPSAQIRNEGFETTRVPENSFTATIGNVPFGGFALHDPSHNRSGHNIHNHFILKSLALTAPGGYVATISSHFTMDSANRRAREDIADVADLVGAVRLPTKAFERVAGTDVVTDIIILRKREEGREPAPGQDWVATTAVAALDQDGTGTETDINAYFAANPDNVLGELRLGHGMYNAETLEVRATGAASLPEQVRERLAAITTEATRAGLGLTATAETTTTLDAATFDQGLLSAADARQNTALGTLRYDADANALRRWDGGRWAEHPARAGKVAETRKLLHLRDISTALIRAQRDGLPAGDRHQLRGELNRSYDAYVTKHGPINRFTWTNPADITTAKHDERMAKSEERWRRKNAEDGLPYPGPVPVETRQEWDEKAWEPVTPSKREPHLDGGIRFDPSFATVAALEVFDEETQTARKAPIFATDVVGPRPARTSAATVEAALAISLDETRTVDVHRIATLLGIDSQQARESLAGKVYPDTDDPTVLIPAAVYLSGNVRRKLADAESAATSDPTYLVNVEALREVQPRTIEAAEIGLRPGVPWIPVADYRQFVIEVLGARDAAVDYTLGQWSIDVPKWQRDSPLMTDTYGTGHKDAVELLVGVCNSRSIQVMRPKEDIEARGGDVLDMNATFAAQAQARKITETFAEWLWTDPDRSERLVGVYNERFNSLRTTRYDGSGMELPGLGDQFTPHPYQRDAAARIVAEPTVLLDHVVGAGKTGSMFMGAMELKRLGLVSQPWIVVPNHIIEQVGREAAQWYPAANVLVGASGGDAEDRRRFVAQTATSDWDMVIVAKSVFTAIKVSPERQAQHLDDAVAVLKDGLADRGEKAIKRVQLAIKQMEGRITKLTEQGRKDTGITFEDSGCDYVMIDEAHMYKNRFRASEVAELACAPGAKQAEDLVMKLSVLRDQRRDRDVAEGRAPGPERVATFATGTPVANSLGEMWVMQSYLRPDLLADAGVEGIDAWGAVFTASTTTVEMNATGSKLRPVTRVGAFTNVPELVTMSSVYTDAVTREQVAQNGRVPILMGGQRTVISKQASQEVRDFITDLAWRSTTFDPKRPDVDNSLKVSNDGRNVSMDERLANLDEPLDGGRVDLVATQVHRVWQEHRDTRYYDETGAAEPTPGGLQILFCDRSTPHQKGGRWSLYEGLRDELTTRGIPAEQIRFIHDYPKPADKTALFRDCRSGKVAVLMGSTEKMGTGTNIQDRAIALHHMDVPWRPADLEQREGRILRQGNQNPEVSIYNYVTEGTFDTIMWQTVERKARFIAQLKTGDTTHRTVADIGGDDLGNAAAATKAVATGDTRYVEQVELDDAVKRLTAMQRAHSDAKGRNASERRMVARDLTACDEQIAALDAVLPTLRANEGAPFAMTVRGRTYRERVDAAPALVDSLRQAYADGHRHGNTKSFPVVSLRGVEITASRMLSSDELIVTMSVPGAARSLRAKDFNGLDTAPVGLVRRMENMVAGTENYRTGLENRRDNNVTRVAELESVADAPFEHTAELADKRQRLEVLTAELQMSANSPQAQAAEAEHTARLQAQGRKPGWSLAMNPTPALRAEYGDAALAVWAGRHERSALSEADTAPAGSGEAAVAVDDEQRQMRDVMAGRRTKTIQQIVTTAAHGTSATTTTSSTEAGKTADRQHGRSR